MTGPEATAPEPVAEPYAVVEAFLDGEAVDPGRLRHALAEPAVRDHLVDLLVLREGVRAITPGSWSSSRAATGGSTAAMARCGGGRAGGAERRLLHRAADGRGVRTARGRDDRRGREHAPRRPRPTQVIRLERGVNWTDGPTGK